ncbi:MAG TPA: OmpA family protein [Candidatus Krumholzibacteria bacterium]|nr:OmpA family protein [Candidatus Krumholzibacteria bacterium]
MKTLPVVLVAAACVALTGCSNKELMQQKDAQIGDLQQQVSTLQSDLDQQQQMNAQLKSSLADLEAENKLLMEEKDGLTHITLDGAATFGTAQAWLTDDAKNTMDRIWDVLQNYPDRRILIEGHTDNRNIAPSYRDRFPTNWELSTARAQSVLHYMTAKHNADYARFAVVGYGPSVPVASNDTPEGRAQNRRVVITVGSKEQIEQRVADSSTM